MYRLRVETRFDAAHKLEGYGGKCSRLHGHSWRVEIFITGQRTDEIGMLLDYGILKEKLREVTNRLDHSYINDFTEIGNPTSENISKYIFKSLSKTLKDIHLEKVRVWENPENWCEYFE